MARPPKKTKGGRGRKKRAATAGEPGHNSEALVNKEERAKIIRAACRDISGIQSKIDALNGDIRTIKSERVKGKLGMKIADFNAILRLHDLEDDDRLLYLDTLREGFEALQKGESLDMFDIAQKADEIRETRAKEAEKGEEEESELS